MGNLDYKLSYKRNLPHIQPKGATFFVTFRLKDSIPQSVLREWQNENEAAEIELQKINDGQLRQAERYKEQRRQYGRMDNYLNLAKNGPTWLSHPEIAKLVVDALHYRDGSVFRLDAFCLMANHGHIVIEPFEKEDEYHSLASIMPLFQTVYGR